MKAEKETIQKIIKDIFISLLLYATPVLLMLLTFKLTGRQPWKNKVPHAIIQPK